MAKIKNLATQLEVIGSGERFDDNIEFYKKKNADGDIRLGVNAVEGRIRIYTVNSIGVDVGEVESFDYADIKEPTSSSLSELVEVINGYISSETVTVDSGFIDNTFRISDNVDDTKKIAFEAGSISTGNVRTVTVPDRDVKLSEVAINATTTSTSWEGSAPVISANGTTLYDMTSAVLIHKDHSSFPTIETRIVVPAVTGGAIMFRTTDPSTHYSIGVSGIPTQRNRQTTSAESRDFCDIGLISHPDLSTIDEVVNTPTIQRDILLQLKDLYRALGFFSKSGNGVTGNSGLTMNKAEGVGVSWSQNAGVDPKNPHTFTNATLSPAILFQILQDATVITTSATIDPTTYDNAGTETTLGANKNATINYIYLFPNNQMVFLKGQEEFADFNKAKDAAGSESFIIPTDLASGGLLLGRFIMKKDTANLNDTGKAVFIPEAGVGGGSQAIPTFQAVYNNSSPNPEMETDATNGSLTIRTYSGGDATDAIEVQDNAGNNNFSVKGNGNTTIGGFLKLDFESLVLSSGAATATQSLVHLDTESLAATDDCDTINGAEEGRILHVHAEIGSRTVTMKDGTGNLRMNGDFDLNALTDMISFIGSGLGNWIETSRSNNGA